MILLEKQLLSDALGRFSRYMREEGENLTPEEVRRIRSVLNDIYKVAFELFNGKSYSRENRINTSEYINALLKQNNGKNPNAGKTL